MTKPRNLLRLTLAAALVGAAFLGLEPASADHLSADHLSSDHGAPRAASISLFTHELQPITRSLGFRVHEASVKDRQLWVIGEVVNLSGVTYSQVRVVIAIEHGAEQRLTIGRLAPAASRRVQVRLATDFEHAPRYLHIVPVEVIPDYRPTPRRWPGS